MGLFINYLNQRIVWGGGEGIYWYPYLKQLIELLQWGWAEQLLKINEGGSEQNWHQKEYSKS